MVIKAIEKMNWIVYCFSQSYLILSVIALLLIIPLSFINAKPILADQVE